MKGIAAAHAHTATAQINTVDRYAEMIRAALPQSIGPDDQAQETAPRTGEAALLVFLAENQARI